MMGVMILGDCGHYYWEISCPICAQAQQSLTNMDSVFGLSSGMTAAYNTQIRSTIRQMMATQSKAEDSTRRDKLLLLRRAK